MLAQELHRLKRCRSVEEIVVATTEAPADDCIVDLARQEGVRWFRGSERDVLSRYMGAAAASRAEMIVRVTADCPLIDPEQTDRVIEELQNRAASCDYASNVVRRTFPQGLDTEAFFRDVLERMNRLATSSEAREHVTYFLRVERPDLFGVHSVTDREDNSGLRWTVDTAQDFEVIRQIYEKLSLGEIHVTYRDLLARVRADPQLSAVHSESPQPVGGVPGCSFF